jgi:hypothetical protein
MLGRNQADPLARQASLAIAGGRLAVGGAALFATRPALRALGFGETDSSGLALAKMLGGRDLAMGGLAIAVRDDPAALRAVTLAAAVLDSADAVTFSFALGDPETRRAGIAGVASAAAAALVGLWAWRRLAG